MVERRRAARRAAGVRLGGPADTATKAFYEDWLHDHLLHLPVGRWRVTALAKVVEGEDCSAPAHDLTAQLTLEVVP